MLRYLLQDPAWTSVCQPSPSLGPPDHLHRADQEPWLPLLGSRLCYLRSWDREVSDCVPLTWRCVILSCYTWCNPLSRDHPLQPVQECVQQPPEQDQRKSQQPRRRRVTRDVINPTTWRHHITWRHHLTWRHHITRDISWERRTAFPVTLLVQM